MNACSRLQCFHPGYRSRRRFERICTLDDAECLHELKHSKSPVTCEIADRLYRPAALQAGRLSGQDQINVAVFQSGWSVEQSRQVAEDIPGMAGCRATDVLVDIPPVPGDMSLEVQVKNRHAIVGFAELSPRLRTLNQTRREQWRLGVHPSGAPRCGCRCSGRNTAYKKAYPAGYPFLITSSRCLTGVLSIPFAKQETLIPGISNTFRYENIPGPWHVSCHHGRYGCRVHDR